MDGNKDEAARCIKLAEAAVASGEKQRASKFIRIAKRLDGDIHVDGLLEACEKLDSLKPSSHGELEPSNVSESSNVNSSYTGDHVRLIREIKKHKDYYAILGIEKSCSVEEIRRAYKRLSLKVHPDKNKALGADDAFKSVCKAFKCLSDEQSRRQYDQTGPVDDFELINQHHNDMRRRRRRPARDGYFEEGFDPDEIFRSFFASQGDAFRAQRVHRTRATTGQQTQHREHNFQGGQINFIILFQVLLLLLFLLFAFLPFSEPQFSLQKTYTYKFPKVTERYGVDYFVRSEEFDDKFPIGSSGLDKIEKDVLRSYKSLLGRYCQMELQRRQWMRSYPTPHCDKLRSLEVA